MRLVLSICFSVLLTGAAFANNPVPFINQPLVPTAVAPGGPGFNGDGSPDAGVVNSADNTVSILLDTPAHLLTASATYKTGSNPQGIAGDFKCTALGHLQQPQKRFR